jgi:beta-lactamase regulating signal transducer with metallopeptidase domain
MSSIVYYLLQVIVSSGILYLYYLVFLRNKRFHQYNRFFLLGTVVMSILIPFLHIPVHFTQEETTSSVVARTLTILSSPQEAMLDNTGFNHRQTSSSVNTIDLAYCFYALIAGLALVRIIFGLFRIKKLGSRYPVEKLGNIKFVNTDDAQAPFSFFNWLFWNRAIELKSEKGEQVFRHELFHIRQRHSLDIVFLEIVSMIFWINPFFHLIKKETRAIHEFLADQYALDKGCQWNYAETLLMHALQTKHSLVNQFFHNQIKRRIAMITNPQKTSHQYLRKMLVLPVAAVVVTLFAFSYRKSSHNPVLRSAEKPITVIIDAGHGGIDPGAKSPDNQQNKKLAVQHLPAAILADSLPKKYNIKSIDIKVSEGFTIKGENIKIHVPEKMGDQSKFDLIVLNGELLTLADAKKKFSGVFIRYADVTMIPANDKNAIEKYGDLAKTGVLVIKDAVIERTRIDAGTLMRNQENDPLIIVDGKILPRGPLSDGQTNMLGYLDPNTIMSINVLKDQSAIDLYGEKGKNGVIVINLKKQPVIPTEEKDSVYAELTIVE